MRLAGRIRLLYWWIMRPKTRGARGIVLNETGEILLVRHRYTKGWYLPGGRISQKEDAKNALVREIREETGLVHVLVGRQLGTYTSVQEYKQDTIEVFLVQVSETLSQRLDIEIEQVSFFRLEELPDDVSPATRRRIEEYLGETSVSLKW